MGANDYYHPYKKALSTAQMQTNAVYFRNYLQNQGWSLNAIAAVLGNWQSECTLNPNRPQKSTFPSTTGGGFGLPQWTPWGKKYGAWCRANNIAIMARDDNPSGEFEPQIAYHDYECTQGYNGGRTWFNNHGYHYSWAQFKVSTDAPETLAAAYYWQYERSAAHDPGSRPSQARTWYTYLSGQAYNPVAGVGFNNPFLPTQANIGNFRTWLILLIIMLLMGGKRK